MVTPGTCSGQQEVRAAFSRSARCGGEGTGEDPLSLFFLPRLSCFFLCPLRSEECPSGVAGWPTHLVGASPGGEGVEGEEKPGGHYCVRRCWRLGGFGLGGRTRGRGSWLARRGGWPSHGCTALRPPLTPPTCL